MIKQVVWMAILATATTAGSWYGANTMSVAQPLDLGPRLTKQQNVDSEEAWVPVDRIDPDRPAAVVLVNDSNVPLEYAFSTTEMEPRTLAAGETVVLNDVPVPSTLLVNALTSATVLDYAFGASPAVDGPDNATTVTISLVDQQVDAAGFSAIDIHETGALYRY